MFQNREFTNVNCYQQFTRDLLGDRFYLWLERGSNWLWVYAAHASLFLFTGFVIAGWQFGLSLLVWGVFIRTVATWHITWSVNSVTHVWGYRNYATPDNSRNNFLVGLLSNGEGWHNNHHADQRAAAHGHRWWEMDITYLTICLLEKVGLARDVIRPRPVVST
jgi:stearoyl-CoA desaturase (delta-9 desaturase)